MEAGCSLADGCPADRFRAWRARHPGAVAITYINCSAAVKAESDYICTSSNAEKIVRAIPEDKRSSSRPTRTSGAYLEKKLGRKMVLWQGSCIVHETFSERKLHRAARAASRTPKLIAHPECEEPILRRADLHRLDDRAAQVRDESASARVHRGHRGRHPAPDGKRRRRTKSSSRCRPRATARATSART